MFHLLLFVIFWTVNAVAASSPSSTPRVAVVGCGVGGSAASFYLQDLFKNNSLPAASITAFEATGRIGGRLKHISFGKQQATIEVGGAAWTSSNQFVKELARRVMNISKINDTNLTKLDALLNKKVGVWRGKNGFAQIVEEIALQADSVLKVLEIEEKFLNNTAENYLAAKAAPPFKTVVEFIKYGNIKQFTNETILNYLTSEGVSKTIIEDVLVPINRAIYNQNSNSSAFSLFGSLTALRNHESVPSGNSNLVKELFQAAQATIRLSEKVVSIEKRKIGEKMEKSIYVIETSKGHSEEFDVVMIAAPLEITNISFKGFNEDENYDRIKNTFDIVNRQYYPWYVTVVEAENINVNQFHQKSKVILPHILLTNANGTTINTPWVCIQPVGKHGKNGTDTKNVYMVYSDQPIIHNRTVLQSIFIQPNTNTIYEQYWPYTFAHLYPTSKLKMLQPIELSSGLYNLNALESLASAMEISAISAHNGARLAYDYLNLKRIQNSVQNSSENHAVRDRITSTKWELSWYDEFNGNSLNLTKWTIANNFTHCYPPDPCDEDQLYLKDAIKVNNGKLQIITNRKQVIGPNGVKKAFTSGWIDTKNTFQQKYGKFEINCSMPTKKATGVWPAFWLLPSLSSKLCWPTGGEIDAFEFVGNPFWLIKFLDHIIGVNRVQKR